MVREPLQGIGFRVIVPMLVARTKLPARPVSEGPNSLSPKDKGWQPTETSALVRLGTGNPKAGFVQARQTLLRNPMALAMLEDVKLRRSLNEWSQ